jgi:hypothetical protein
MTEGTDYCRSGSRVRRKGILQTNLLMTKNLRTKITIMRNNRGSHKQRQLTKSDIVKSQ